MLGQEHCRNPFPDRPDWRSIASPRQRRSLGVRRAGSQPKEMIQQPLQRQFFFPGICMIRLAHFSDIHLSSPRFEWKLEDWFSKRLTSWLNHRFLGRARRFALAEDIVARLMDDLLERRVDHLVFSGDATALGFESEIRRAADFLRIGQFPIPGLAIPGNHDYCTRRAAASGAFERHFDPWQKGRRIGEHRYPFAQQVGPLWLIGVNAATGNRWLWDASGSVDASQRGRLQQLLAGLGPGLKILVL